MLITAVFETRKGNAKDGKIVATFTDDLGTSSTNFTIGLGVTSPIGEVLADYNTNVAVLVIGGTNTLEVTIPFDSSGDYLAGEYQLQLSYFNVDSSQNGLFEPGYIYTPKNSPDHTVSDLVAMTTLLDCDAETLVAKDVTEYGDVDMLTRLITITPPSITGLSPDTTATSQLTAAITYTHVTYSSLLEVSFEYNALDVDEGVGVISRGSAAIYKEDVVDCDAKTCIAAKCIASKLQALKAKAMKVGGWSGLSSEDTANFFYAVGLVTTAQQMRACGDYAASKPFLDEAILLLNCDCGCSENNAPIPLSGMSSAPRTNLGYEYDGVDLVVTSSTGDDVTLPVADGTHNGLLSAAYKTSVDDAIDGLGTDITDINTIISNANLIGINGVATANSGSTVTLGPNTSFYRLNAASSDITVVLDSTQMSIGRLYVISAYPDAGRFILWTLNGLTVNSTGNTSNGFNTLNSLSEQRNYTVILFRIGTKVFATVLKDSIVTS